MLGTDETQIRELITNWAASVRAHNIEGILAHHSKDILLFDVPEPLQSKGIEAYRNSWERTFYPWYGTDGTFELSELAVTAGTETAFCTGIIDCSGTEQGLKTYYRVRLTVGLIKDGGQWIITHEHHSATAP